MATIEEIQAVLDHGPEELAAIREAMAPYTNLEADSRAIMTFGVALGIQVGRRLAEKAKA